VEARRLAYLEALGLDALELRGGPARETVQPASPGSLAVEPVAGSTESAPVASRPPVEALPWEDEAEASARGFRESARPAPAPPVIRSPAANPAVPPSRRPTGAAPLAAVSPSSAVAKAPLRTPHPAGKLDWEPLAAAVDGCQRCGLCAGRTRAVFGQGARRARWMVIGEAPGVEEDRDGDPCAGKAGELLTAMLRACGVQREDVFVTNVLKCRPPDNREPEAAEVAECLPYLLNQLALVQPELVICLGRAPAQALLGTDLPLAKLRGQVHRLQTPAVPVVVTYHPTYLLRAPQDKRKAWEDLQFAMAQVAPMAGTVPSPPVV
jgi:uracil-DNA glycosylase family 4